MAKFGTDFLEKIRSYLNKKEKEYPELTGRNWLNDFANFVLHYNNLITKLQGCESIIRNLVEKNWKYFSLLKKTFWKF